MTVYLVAGPPAVGKSTVTRMLAQALPHCVLVDVDRIRYGMVVTGVVLPSAEWPRDLIDDFLDPHTLLAEYESIADLDPVRVVLMPDQAVARARNLSRGEGVEFIDAGISDFYSRVPTAADLQSARWTVIDNSTLSPEHTRDRILALT